MDEQAEALKVFMRKETQNLSRPTVFSKQNFGDTTNVFSMFHLGTIGRERGKSRGSPKLNVGPKSKDCVSPHPPASALARKCKRFEWPSGFVCTHNFRYVKQATAFLALEISLGDKLGLRNFKIDIELADCER